VKTKNLKRRKTLLGTEVKMAQDILHSEGRAVATKRAIRRARVASAILMLILAALIGRTAHLQFSNPEQYTRFATVHRPGGRAPARRGNIYDREGRLLATSVPQWSVFADPSEVKAPLETARILARVLDADQKTVNNRLSRSGRRFVWIKRQVSPSRAEWVRALGLKGVYLRKEYERFHPKGSLCAHLVGFTDIDGRGLEGLEAYFDSMLNGPAREKEGDNGASIRGYDVHLTVDSYIQGLTRKALMRQVERHQPEAAWALVLDARNGEVLSMVNYPQYDPGAPSNSPDSHRRNRVLTDTYEYGSVLKPINVAIAIEKGIVEPDTEFDCHRGAWRFGRRTIRDVSEHGTLTVSDIVTRSSNIGMAQIGLKLEAEDFREGLTRFGFGELTGMELPGEKIGIMRPVSAWNDHSLISIAFGQEVSINALALARAFMALANDGILLRPSIVQEVTDPLSGAQISQNRRGADLRTAVSPDTAELVNEMLVRVVEEGTGSRAAVEGYSAAGKTGTGTLMCEDNLRYSRGRYISTFVGFAPAEDPRLVVLVSLKVPTAGGYYGGTVAGPAFSEIVRQTLGYLNVAPDTITDLIAKAEDHD